jgi:glycosyltransferase involved in cell wall biosynthesis
MRIGVNALYLLPGEVGGTEIYLRNLLAAFAQELEDHEYILFTNRETGADLAPADPRFQTWPQPIAARFRPGRLLWEQLALSTGDCDVLLNPGFTSPWLCGCPQLTWIHDLQHKRHPEYFKPADLLAWRLFVWASARRAAHILTLSESSREDIHHFYGTPLDRIHIAAPGVGEVFPALHAQRSEPIVLCVSTLHPHKGIETLLDAFQRFRVHHPEFRLVLAGMKGFHTQVIQAKAGPGVEITGWLDREDLYDLYRRASLFVFPSTFEGFGMPILEAMASGLPTVCAEARPMSDVSADGALHFKTGDPADLARQMEQALVDPTLIERGRRRAAQFTWRQTARTVLDLIALTAKPPASRQSPRP